MTETIETDSVFKGFDPDPSNGVYLFEVSKLREGYLVESKDDSVWAEKVWVNGRYIGVRDSIEIECDDFETKPREINLVCDNEEW